jgi:hypothetical protein
MAIYTVNEIYDLLIDEGIKTSTGEIRFEFMNSSLKLQERSAIGDLFQEWLAQWFTRKGIEYRTQDNTQIPPDFFINPPSVTNGLLEIKTFNYNANPAFDIANFEAFCYSIQTEAYRLNANYLIFGYRLEQGNFTIVEVWNKKIWEITGSSDKYGVVVQDKKGTIYNIRPIKWYSKKARNIPFGNLQEFILGLDNALKKYGKTSIDTVTWLDKVNQNYLHYMGKSIF